MPVMPESPLYSYIMKKAKFSTHECVCVGVRQTVSSPMAPRKLAEPYARDVISQPWLASTQVLLSDGLYLKPSEHEKQLFSGIVTQPLPVSYMNLLVVRPCIGVPAQTQPKYARLSELVNYNEKSSGVDGKESSMRSCSARLSFLTCCIMWCTRVTGSSSTCRLKTIEIVSLGVYTSPSYQRQQI